MFINPNNKFNNGENEKFKSLITKLIDLGKRIKIKTGENLITEGYNCDFFYFIESGKFRTFRFLEDKEVTIGFTFKGDLDTCPYSFYNNLPSKDTIQALSDGTVVKVYHDQLERLGQEEQILEEFIRYMQSSYIETLIQRFLEFKVNTAEIRYLDMLKKQPDELRGIPLQYLASYLGISKERLSRIRKKHSKLT